MEISHQSRDKKLFYSDVAFSKLMHQRINKVLLICSKYDAFMLEEDGRIDEQIFNEYVFLNLRYPPQFIQVSTSQKALKVLQNEKIDLVINMLSVGDMDPFVLSKEIKLRQSKIPIVVLTPFSREVSTRLEKEDLSAIDYVFSWLGNANILLAIVKLIEDKMNADYDVHNVGVQVIILVEDSIRFYSSYLPIIFKIIFQQSKEFMTEGLNEHQKMMRMRGRPKILLANNYEEAVELYKKFKNNVLGIISDISYKREGIVDEHAGLLLCKNIKAEDTFLPFLLQSSDASNAALAQELEAGFIDKNSKNILRDLREFIKDNFAFGDFVFRHPKTNIEVARANDLKSLQDIVWQVDDEVLFYHISHNHFSRWLRARALFHIADMFRKLRPEDFKNLNEVRAFISDSLAGYRRNTGRGVIAKFYRDKFDKFVMFARIGEGSIGGKARGLAFIDALLKQNQLHNHYPGVFLTIPRTVVISTDYFDDFMERNDLFKVAMSDLSDAEILKHFTDAEISEELVEDLKAYINVVNKPIAIRSSSLLEDSHYQPYAGVYSTYMLPLAKDRDLAIRNLSKAIKSVYASVYFKDSKMYMAATKNVIDEEKMAIVLQEVCGSSYGDYFLPTFSGVTRSINYYPIADEKSTDGVVEMAMGLGKHIVDGSGNNLRFAPSQPKKILQLSTPNLALTSTQQHFYALKLNEDEFCPTTDDDENLVKISIRQMPEHKSFRNIISTYDFQSVQLRDGYYEVGGRKIISFANVLKYDKIPLAEMIQEILRVGHAAMNNPVEIEFAVNMNCSDGNEAVFSLLQIRPVVEMTGKLEVKLDKIYEEKSIVSCYSSLGNGVIEGIFDVLYVKPENFSATNNPTIAHLIEKANEKLAKENRNYVLIGPGRWGSSDHWLGIPVTWPQISNARVIIESGLKDYRIDPSQGTHFFQNLTSFSVGYFTINPFINEGYYDVTFLNSCEAEYEDEFIRLVHFDQSMPIFIDSRKNRGVIYKPGTVLPEED